MLLLNDEEWNAWADREIARRCAVHNSFVSKMRLSLSPNDSEQASKTYTTKHGTEATMRTENIGKRTSAGRLYTPKHGAEAKMRRAASARLHPKG